MSICLSVFCSAIAADKPDSVLLQPLNAAREHERRQLISLWNGCMEKSGDVQFVFGKLLPSGAQARDQETLLGIFSTELWSKTQIDGDSFLLPDKEGRDHFYQVIHDQLPETKKVKRKLDEQIMLYETVRGQADRMAEYFQNYKTAHKALLAAEEDLRDFDKSRDPNADADHQEAFNSGRQKLKHDIKTQKEGEERYRSNLVELCGLPAVTKFEADIRSSEK